MILLDRAINRTLFIKINHGALVQAMQVILFISPQHHSSSMSLQSVSDLLHPYCLNCKPKGDNYNQIFAEKKSAPKNSLSWKKKCLHAQNGFDALCVSCSYVILFVAAFRCINSRHATGLWLQTGRDTSNLVCRRNTRPSTCSSALSRHTCVRAAVP